MVSRPLIAQGYSLAEEVANSISHGIGTVFGIVGLVLLLVQAVDTNASAMAITSYSLYGGSMILLFWPQRCITLFRINGRRYGSRNLTTALSIFLLRVPIRRFCWWGSTHRCRVA